MIKKQSDANAVDVSTLVRGKFTDIEQKNSADQIRFTSFAPPADQAAIDAWNGAGHGGSLTLDQGWLWLSSETAVAGNASTAFSGWNTLLVQFAAQFDG